MKRKNTIVARRKNDGSLVRVGADGSTQPLVDRTDWKRLRRLTDEEVEAAARSDPDNPPRTEAELAKMRRIPRVKTLRRALHLTQEEFAARYHIPLGTLRDWEQGRSEPDQPARAYLRVIASDPQRVERALKTASG
jgi:putative transcriptional regulator